MSITPKHTPGPWDAAETPNARGCYSIEPIIGCAYGESDESRANARLIAAAPDLLEFAEEVRRSGDTRLASMAIAVIAKATAALTANQAAIAAEREACAAIAAKVGDDLDASGEGLLPCEAAYRVESAIRARGEMGKL